MKQLFLFDTEDNTLAVGDRVRITNEGGRRFNTGFAEYLAIPEGTKALIIRIHPDKIDLDGCTVRFDDYTPTRSGMLKISEYALCRSCLKKLSPTELRNEQLDRRRHAINELNKFLPSPIDWDFDHSNPF